MITANEKPVMEETLPADWRVVRLGEVAEKPQYGFTASARREAVGPKMLRITDIQNGSVNWDNVPYCECPKEEILRYLLRPGDILFARTGSVGKAFLVSYLPEPAIFASYLIRFRVNTALLDPQFAYLFMQSTAYWSQIASQTHGAVQPNVNATQLRSLFIPLPPLAEQRAIAHVLRTVQRAQEASERVIAALKELKKSLMRHLFTYGPVPVGATHASPRRETQLGPLPAHWQVVRLGEVAETKSGGTPDRKRDEFFGGRIPWIKSGELRDAAIEFTEESLTESGLLNSSARIFPKGTLLMAMYGATTGKVGLLKINAATNQAVCAIFPHNEMSSEYLFYMFIYRRDELLTERYGGAQPNISQTILKHFLIPLPPLPEQQEIARILQAVDRRIEAEEAYARAAQELFRSLLRELMSGRRRLPAEFVAHFQQEEPHAAV
ncbi:MAG: hypothetical protein KatS3mg052_1780 [Candidatus Roseilinea sp.]|nr:MAG: hypothetical protein KatS3mg052_1780 [Candidatus Roseilinea sp.]